jgi:hypothetical protein
MLNASNFCIPLLGRQISSLSVRGIPCVARRHPTDENSDAKTGLDEEVAPPTATQSTEEQLQRQQQKRVGSCYLVVKCITRSGAQKNVFQTKVRADSYKCIHTHHYSSSIMKMRI